MTCNNGRTAQEQLAILDERLGKDKGAARERAKLNAEIGEVAKALYFKRLAEMRSDLKRVNEAQRWA